MVNNMRKKWMRVLCVAGSFLAVLLIVIFASHPVPLHAENERVITVYYDGIEQTIVTDAQTVAAALDRAHVTINKNDAVEPSADTKLVAPAYSINVYRARPVTVVDGAERYTIMTSHTSAREIVEAAGLKLYDEDTYDLNRIDNFIVDGGIGLKLTLHRAIQMNLVLYGKSVQIRTQAKTVGELMAQKGIVLAADDGINLAVGTPIAPNLTLEVWRNGVQTVTNEEDVAFSIKQVRDSDHAPGYKAITTPGVLGKKQVTYQIEMKNGKEVSRKIIQAVTTKAPEEQVEVIGVQVGFTDAFKAALVRLSSCEGKYTSINNRAPDPANWYYGAYQFNIATWRSYAPAGFADVLPSNAPPEIQDQAAYNLYLKRGWQPWPTCAIKMGLQDIYR